MPFLPTIASPPVSSEQPFPVQSPNAEIVPFVRFVPHVIPEGGAGGGVIVAIDDRQIAMGEALVLFVRAAYSQFFSRQVGTAVSCPS